MKDVILVLLYHIVMELQGVPSTKTCRKHCWFQKGPVVFPYALWSCGLKARAWKPSKAEEVTNCRKQVAELWDAHSTKTLRKKWGSPNESIVSFCFMQLRLLDLGMDTFQEWKGKPSRCRQCITQWDKLSWFLFSPASAFRISFQAYCEHFRFPLCWPRRGR